MKEIILTFHDEIIFKAIFLNLTTYRIVIDEINLEDTVKQLISDGSVRLTKVDETIYDDYKNLILEPTITPIKDVDDLMSALSNLGYKADVQIPSTLLTIVANGKSLHPKVISQTNDNRLSLFAVALIKEANNISYEPPLQKEAGSFKIEIVDTGLDKKQIEDTLLNLKNLQITDIEKYSTIISKLEDISKIKDLDTIDIPDFNISFTKKDIKEILKTKTDYLKKKIIEIIVNSNTLRNFDPHNNAFKGDMPNMVYFKMTNEVFEEIHSAHINQLQKDFELKGYFANKTSFVVLSHRLV